MALKSDWAEVNFKKPFSFPSMPHCRPIITLNVLFMGPTSRGVTNTALIARIFMSWHISIFSVI